MFASVGITEEQVFGDLYHAWLKDTGEKNTNDSRKLFREVMEHGFGERQITLRKERLGANVAASLAALLHRSPLSRLDLHGNTLRDAGCEMIAYLIRDIPNLLYLDLGANDIGPLGMQTLSYVLSGHKKLQTIILGSSKHDAYANRINASSAILLLESCLRSRTLRHLDLSGSMIGEHGSKVKSNGTTPGFIVGPPRRNSEQPSSSVARRNQIGFMKTPLTPAAASGGAGNPVSADMGDDANNLNDDHSGVGNGGYCRPVDVLAELISTSSTLTTLKLREVMLTTSEALRLVTAARESSSLAFIDLSGNALTRAVGDAFGELIRARAGFQSPSALHTILLNNNPLMRSNRGMPPPLLFSALSRDSILVQLHLDSCGIDDAAMEPLCLALGSNNQLQSLHLKNNAITATGAVSLARVLYRHSHLMDVSLEGNVLKDEGICAFAQMLECNSTLLSLNLARTWMGECGVVALGVSLNKNKMLQRLQIDDNHFTDEAGEAFAALLESNRFLLRCGLSGNSMGFHTVLRVEKITARNREEYRNAEKVDLEKNVIHLHYQMYKLDEARTELENLRQRKIEMGRTLDAFEVQFKQETSNVAKKLQDLQEALAGCMEKEAHCLNEKRRLDDELEQAHKKAEVDMETLKERLEVVANAREKMEEEHRNLKAQVDDMTHNGPQREAAKRQQLREINEDRQQWASQRREYRAAISEVQAALKELREKGIEVSKASGPKQSKKKKKKKSNA
ncbi:putative leucine rich repeat protein (LRRP) [Trypanosoma vivax]|uniref:Leucine-rich repeat protein (LRRP) n=1 Tax=Trypanosoma vivax (strain Y486) TaxID=1055687 RepID=G0TRH2_TRYVY|nr:hypothetical protein TRVL_09131 [Trypanosoma vivax]KAH8604058.1 putative leucine rich repeat protein (LRRP) [Trypanosoma vivax]CCC46536.1 conserved hypothetical protein [Trypanosoma vivax Y486]